jgi:8-oxo-dGTP diphosphatase
VFQLRFTTLVEAPLTVAFDVARSLGRPWRHPLEEVVSERPWRDVYRAAPGDGRPALVHTRRFSATGDGTLVDEQVEWDTALGRPADRLLLRGRIERAMQAHLDAYAAAAARRALDVTQVVGAALVDDRRRVLVAQRGSGPLAGLWEFPGGKVDPGESATEALHREIREELGVAIRTGPPVPAPGGWPLGDRYRMHVWLAVVTDGDPQPIEDHDALQWLDRKELFAVGWLPADLPIVQALERLMVGSTPNP